MGGILKISGAYRICNIVGETYMVPEVLKHGEMGSVKQICGSGVLIMEKISEGKYDINALKDVICSECEVEDRERKRVCESVERFVGDCVEKGYVVDMV